MDFNPYYSVDCCRQREDMLNHLSDFLSGHDFQAYKRINIELESPSTMSIKGYRHDGIVENVSTHGRSFHIMECKKKYVR